MPRYLKFIDNLENTDEFTLLTESNYQYQGHFAMVGVHNSKDLSKHAYISNLGPMYGMDKLGGLGGFYLELQDENNIFGMKGFEGAKAPFTMFASLARRKASAALKEVSASGKNAELNFVSIIRWYGLYDGRNKTEYLRLPDDEKFYCLKQMRTRYIIVSTGKQL